MPEFIVMGAVKAGTTSLYHYLGQHPGLQMSTENWPRFFHVDGGEPDLERLRATYGETFLRESVWRYKMMCHRRVPRTVEAYEAMWPARPGAVRGEVSPTYLHDPVVPERILRRYPDVRMIVVLRQPADRAYSHFVMDVTRGWVPERSLAAALQNEPKSIDSFWWGARHYFRHGLYSARVAHLMKVVRPERLRVCLYDDFVADSAAYMRDLFGFLGVDPAVPIDTSQRHNEGLVPMRKGPGAEEVVRVKPPPLSPEFRAALTRHFRPDIERLQGVIGRDLSGWLA